MKVHIYFTAVGMIDIPIEKEIQAMIEEILKKYGTTHRTSSS